MNRIFTDEEIDQFYRAAGLLMPAFMPPEVFDYNLAEKFIIQNAKIFIPYIKDESLKNKLIAIIL